MALKIITAKQQQRSAQIFPFFSSLSVLAMPLIIPMLLWLAASIFVYAAVAHHPNQKVRDYLVPAGYRFYGLVGALVIVLNFSPQMSKWFSGTLNFGPLHLPMFWVWVWVLCLLVVIPLGVWDILRANKELWRDMEVEVESEGEGHA